MNLLESIAGWLNRSPWLNLLSMAVGLLSLALSVYFYIKSRSAVFPRYQTSGASLLSRGVRAVHDLQIIHAGRPLGQLSVSTISFWNQGDKVLEASAVAKADPLRIEFPAATVVLQANVVHQTSASNQVSLVVRANDGTVYIFFDYLSRNEGFTAEIFHDSPDEDCASVLGTIKGFGKPQEVLESDDPVSDNYVRPLFNWLYAKTGGGKTLLFWVLSPLWAIPLVFTLLVDLPLKPLRMLRGRSSSLNAYKHVKRYRQ
jgi:hypothetical protein